MDSSRIILLRSASDFDRPHSGQEAVSILLTAFGGLSPQFREFVGVEQTIRVRCGGNNYVGDISGLLGGKPDFGRDSDVEIILLRKRRLGLREKVS